MDPVGTQTRLQEPRAPRPAVGGSRRRGDGRNRVQTYFRGIVDELSKVVYPSRTELVTYVTVVLVFVSAVVAIVSSLDYGFTQAVLAVFG